MSSPIVFITGATGHVGFKTLTLALEAGYKVRAAVRSEAKKQFILENPVYKALNTSSEQLSFVVVPDLSVLGAYDEAVKGADYIIHIASPLLSHQEMTQEGYHEFFIKPAVQGTVGILDSAKKVNSIKRIVITSSVVAIAEFKYFIGNMESVVKADDRVPDDNGPYPAEFAAYGASKVASLNAAERWIAENKPSFDVVFIHPSFIEGRNDLVQTAQGAFEGTNAFMLGIAVGKEPSGQTLPGSTVHNDDVARLHFEALQSKIPAGSYIANYNPDSSITGVKWENINEYVAKNFPKEVESGVLTNKGGISSAVSRFDSSKTEEVFGWKLQSLEEQVKSVVGHYVELLSKA